MREHKEITLELAPPRRLFDTLRFKSIKLREDRWVFEQMAERVAELANEGWVLDVVHVDWGSRIPGVEAQRDAFIRRLFGNVAVTQGISGQGKGSTILRLSRGHEDGATEAAPGAGSS